MAQHSMKDPTIDGIAGNGYHREDEEEDDVETEHNHG